MGLRLDRHIVHVGWRKGRVASQVEYPYQLNAEDVWRNVRVMFPRYIQTLEIAQGIAEPRISLVGHSRPI